HGVGGCTEPFDPGIGQEFLEEDVAVLEVELALLLRQNLGLDGQNLLGCHVPLLFRRLLLVISEPKPGPAGSAAYQPLPASFRRSGPRPETGRTELHLRRLSRPRPRPSKAPHIAW